MLNKHSFDLFAILIGGLWGKGSGGEMGMIRKFWEDKLCSGRKQVIVRLVCFVFVLYFRHK